MTTQENTEQAIKADEIAILVNAVSNLDHAAVWVRVPVSNEKLMRAVLLDLYAGSDDAIDSVENEFDRECAEARQSTGLADAEHRALELRRAYDAETERQAQELADAFNREWKTVDSAKDGELAQQRYNVAVKRLRTRPLTPELSAALAEVDRKLLMYDSAVENLKRCRRRRLASHLRRASAGLFAETFPA